MRPPRTPWWLKWIALGVAGLGPVAPIGALIEHLGRRRADGDVTAGRPPVDPGQLATRRNRSWALVAASVVGGAALVPAALALGAVSAPVAAAVAALVTAGATAGVTMGSIRAVRSGGQLRRLRELAGQGRLGPPQQPAPGLGAPGIGREFPDPRVAGSSMEFFQSGFGVLRDLAAMGFTVAGNARQDVTHETTVTGPDGTQHRQSYRSGGSVNFGPGFPGQSPRAATWTARPAPRGRPHPGPVRRPELPASPPDREHGR